MMTYEQNQDVINFITYENNEFETIYIVLNEAS